MADLDKRRRKLRAADVALAQTLARHYGTAWQRIRAKLDRLLDRVEAAKVRGETVDVGWLAQHRVAEHLEQVSLAELRTYVDFAERKINKAALDAFLAGRIDAQALIRSSLPPWFKFNTFDPSLPVRQLEKLYGATRQGAPLRGLLDQLGAEQANRARGLLVEGVAVGKGPREIARTLRDSFGGDQVKALRVARTEVIRAYRRASHSSYRQHSDVVGGWVWVASLDARTCGICLGMHGTEHSLDEELDSHVSCRCSPAPLTRSWSELGFGDIPETRVDVGSGEDWFAEQPESVQRTVLGPGKLAEYKAGRLKLADLPQPTVDPVWGPGLREKPLRDLVTV